ncbi:MAG TPA: L-threonylcarbamoyladenylate synthase, partial [Gemmataceae bacterium]|nr:L-threonylcarbamoyladenylate synthase [Gemmataceae bacterium]
MQTQVLLVDSDHPDSDAIARAAEILRNGGLVAFPTETVYGLGANALDPAAVARIFQAKGRPPQNPLIVHVAKLETTANLAADWPEKATELAERFWPGPLTLVVRKRACVPDAVTAGGDTVALRVPSHPVALALLKAANIPIAAPSANRSTLLSPTRAEHVLHGLEGRIDLLLDAGPTPGGLESTVLDVTTNPPRLLRPGLISPAELGAVIGPIIQKESPNPGDTLRSPGMLGRHYA